MAGFNMDVTVDSTLIMRGFDPNSANVSWDGGDNLTTAQQDQIAQGNYGTVTNVKVLDNGQISITTDLGVLTLTGGPELAEARTELEDAGLIQTKLTEQADQVDRLYSMMKLMIGMLAKISKMSFDGSMQSAFLSYGQKMAQAEDMRNAAIFQFAFALTAATVSVVGAGVGFGTACGKGATAGQKSMAMQMGFQGISQGIGAVGSFGQAMFQAAATEHEAEAQKQDAFMQALNQIRQNAQAAMEKVLSTTTSFVQAQTQTNGRLLS